MHNALSAAPQHAMRILHGTGRQKSGDGQLHALAALPQRNSPYSVTFRDSLDGSGNSCPTPECATLSESLHRLS